MALARPARPGEGKKRRSLDPYVDRSPRWGPAVPLTVSHDNARPPREIPRTHRRRPDDGRTTGEARHAGFPVISGPGAAHAPRKAALRGAAPARGGRAPRSQRVSSRVARRDGCSGLPPHGSARGPSGRLPRVRERRLVGLDRAAGRLLRLRPVRGGLGASARSDSGFGARAVPPERGRRGVSLLQLGSPGIGGVFFPYSHPSKNAVRSRPAILDARSVNCSVVADSFRCDTYPGPLKAVERGLADLLAQRVQHERAPVVHDRAGRG